MGGKSLLQGCWSGRYLKVASMAPAERDKMLHDAIAARAFQFAKERNFQPGHQAEDWQRAESVAMRPFNCGFLMSVNQLELQGDATCFGEGDIAIYAEPHRLLVCGRDPACGKTGAEKNGSFAPQSLLVFRFMDLPFEIDPRGVTARFRGRTVEIELPRARATQKTVAAGKAA